jgi:hypothetical protein
VRFSNCPGRGFYQRAKKCTDTPGIRNRDQEGNSAAPAGNYRYAAFFIGNYFWKITDEKMNYIGT